MFLDLSEEQTNYLDTAARLRELSPGRLMARIVKRVIEDQMIISVLDDDDDVIEAKRRARRRRHKERYHGKRALAAIASPAE